MRRVRSVCILSGVLLAGVMVTPAHADTTKRWNVNLPVSANVNVDTTGCSNHPGPVITIDGEFAIGGATIQVRMDNNINKEVHRFESEPVDAEIVVSDAEKTTFAKQPPLGGVTGNPKVYLQLTDSDGGALTGEFYLGRCQSGGKHNIKRNFGLPGLLSLILAAAECENSGGPNISFGSSLDSPGIDAVLTLKGANGKFTDSTDVKVKVQLSPENIVTPKGGNLNGPGGNPWVSAREYVNDTWGSFDLIGRCNKL